MTYKELKPLLNNAHSLVFDWTIYCDIAKICGYDGSNPAYEDHWGDPETYMIENVDVDIWNQIIPITDMDWNKIELFTNNEFLKESFFNDYKVSKLDANDKYDRCGVIVYLTHE